MSHLDRSVQQQPPLNLAGQTCTRLPASFELIIRQQPVRSRMCGVGERVDRRPIDPPPIVQLKLEGQGSDETLQNISPYIFLVAVLVSANEEEEDQVSPPRIDFHSRLTIGRTVSSLYLLRDLNDSEGAFFVFSDISVRVDGHYRLRMCLFELVDSCVHYRRDILTDPFTVYSAKKFPGMHLSCRLARHFAQQGLKIRIRKESRKRGSGSRRHSREQDDDDDADSSSDDRVEPTTVSNDQEEVLFSSSPYHDSKILDERRSFSTTTTDFNSYLVQQQQPMSSSSSTSSHIYRRVSNAESSSSGKMLRLTSTSEDDLLARSNIAFTSPSGSIYHDIQQQQDDRGHLQQAPSSSKINVASLIHPSDSNDPMMDSNEMMGHSATTTTTTIATSSTATTTTDDMLPPYPPTASTSSLSTSVEQSYHPLHPNATTTSTSPFYLRLPPIMFENTTSPSLSSPNKEFYKQSRRSGSEDIRRTSQQQHRPYYEATASLQRGRESSPIMIPGSSSSHHIINLHQPQSHSSSLQPQQQALHPHQQQHQQPYHLPASRRSSKHSSPTIAPPSLPSSSPSIELRPDRPELILQTKPIFPSHIHAQEDVVHLPSLREQFGGLVVPAPSDQEKQDEQQDVGPSHTSGSRMEVGGGIFEASKESNRRTSR